MAAEPKKKDTLTSVSFFLVEVGGVEPPSKIAISIALLGAFVFHVKSCVKSIFDFPQPLGKPI